jgi:hypothetical protein
LSRPKLFFEFLGWKANCINMSDPEFMERAMGIEPIQMAKIKALLPVSWFNWSQIGVNCTEQTGR